MFDLLDSHIDKYIYGVVGHHLGVPFEKYSARWASAARQCTDIRLYARLSPAPALFRIAPVPAQAPIAMADAHVAVQPV